MGNKGRICVGVTPSPIYLESIVFIYRYITNILKHKFVTKVLTHINSSDIAAFRDERLKTITGSSVNRELSVISDCIKKAMTEWQCYIAENPVKPRLRCEENPRRVRRLELGEYEKLMSSCKMNRALI